MGRLFGTDGARGVAVTELTCEIAMQIGRAAAAVLCRGGKKAKVINTAARLAVSIDQPANKPRTNRKNAQPQPLSCQKSSCAKLKA